jgi:hypothetical protein
MPGGFLFWVHIPSWIIREVWLAGAKTPRRIASRSTGLALRLRSPGTEASRFALALKGIIGKRLTYTELTGSQVPQTC